MRVVELWRYPVKSLQGERVDASELGPEGLAGDRRLAIFDVATGFGLTGRREPQLLFAAARTVGDRVEIVLPDGSVARDDADLSEWLGRPVALRSTEDHSLSRRFESPDDPEDEASGQWRAFTGAQGSFRDDEDAPVSIVSTGTLGDWPSRRFRPNVVVDGAGENDLVGSTVTLGAAVLAVQARLGRCVMVTRAQPGIERDLGVLRTVHREFDHTIAVGARVTKPGRVAVGEELGGYA